MPWSLEREARNRRMTQRGPFHAAPEVAVIGGSIVGSAQAQALGRFMVSLAAVLEPASICLLVRDGVPPDRQRSLRRLSDLGVAVRCPALDVEGLLSSWFGRISCVVMAPGAGVDWRVVEQTQPQAARVLFVAEPEPKPPAAAARLDDLVAGVDVVWCPNNEAASTELDRRWPGRSIVTLAETTMGVRTQLALLGVGTRNPMSVPSWEPEELAPPIGLSDGPSLWPLEPELRPIWDDSDSPWDHDRRYQLWVDSSGPTAETLSALAAEIAQIEHPPMFSVLVPVFDAPGPLLEAAIRSVTDQIYPHWQLCLADDGSRAADTLAVLASYASDPRIQVVRLSGNQGISRATNAASRLADGDYVAFLDHDDLLKPHALAQVARWLVADPELDFVYTDEDKVDLDGHLVQPHLKPGWSPNMLMSQNYVCHLSVVRRSLYEELGGLRSRFDGSQDHDLVLRIGERTDRIAHIPEPLYSWRIIPGSTSAGVAAKPYAVAAARSAIGEAMDRRNQHGSVEAASIPGMYRARYAYTGHPSVALIALADDTGSEYRLWLRDLIEGLSYPGLEICTVASQPEVRRGDLPGHVVQVDGDPTAACWAAALRCDAQVLLFIRPGVRAAGPDSLPALLEHAARAEVGAVGPRLSVRGDDHAYEGVVLGFDGAATVIDHKGYWGRGDIVHDTSALPGLCLMTRTAAFERMGGFDPLMGAWTREIDYCLRLREAGLQVVYTPHADFSCDRIDATAALGDDPAFDRRWQASTVTDDYFHPLFQRNHPPFVIGLPGAGIGPQASTATGTTVEGR